MIPHYSLIIYILRQGVSIMPQIQSGLKEKKKKDLLFTLQITCELDSVSEASQRVHAVQHIWVQLSQGQDSPHTHSPGRRLLGTRLVTTTPGSHTHTRWNTHEWHRYNVHDSVWCNITVNKCFIQVCKSEHILTDTRHVSGWPLAVRGDRADGAISFYSLFRARWLQSCAVLTVPSDSIVMCRNDK